MVQVYGLGLEYGFISDSQRETHMRSPLPRPGVTLTTQRREGCQFVFIMCSLLV